MKQLILFGLLLAGSAGCAFAQLDHATMAACYAPDAQFQDEVFTLDGREEVAALDGPGVTALRALPVIFDPTAYRVADILQRATAWRRQYGIRLLVVDFGAAWAAESSLYSLLQVQDLVLL